MQTSWLLTKCGGVEFGTTKDKSTQWRGGGFESRTSGLQSVEELNLGSPRTNSRSGKEEHFNQGPLDYKSSTLPLGHAHLL